MPKYVVVPKLGDVIVGAVDGGESRESADVAALNVLRRNKGLIYDISLNENRPIDSILICEVIHEGVPVFSLNPKE